MQIIVAALREEQASPQPTSAELRLLVEGAQRLDQRIQASVQAEVEVLHA